MPAALVSNIAQRREFAEFKTILNDARNQIVQPVDAELMAQELVESGGREFVEMVRGLTTALTNARQELEDANRRYERLVADLARRGIGLDDEGCRDPESSRPEDTTDSFGGKSESSPDDGLAEWEEWDRRFRSLLD